MKTFFRVNITMYTTVHMSYNSKTYFRIQKYKRLNGSYCLATTYGGRK